MLYSGIIHLTENDSLFFSGDTIKGTAAIQSNEEINIKEICIILEGVAVVGWQDLDQKSKHGEIVYFMQHFESKEIYVERKIPLQLNGILPKGRQEFHFRVKIPENIPSSLTTTTGTIKYGITLVIEDAIHCHKLEHKTIDIRRRLNIAEKPGLMLPFTTQYTQHFCWWPCKSKAITTYLTLSCRALIPGDYINYTLAIENHTLSNDVKRVTAFIIQTIQFKSLKPKQRTKTELSTLNYRTHQNPCERNSNNCIMDKFQLPSDLVVSSQEKSVIMVGYRFQVLIIMKGFHQDCSIEIPLTIGSHRVYGDRGSGDCISKTDTSIIIDGPSLQLQKQFEDFERTSGNTMK